MAAVGDVNQSIFEFSGKKSYYLKEYDKTKLLEVLYSVKIIVHINLL